MSADVARRVCKIVGEVTGVASEKIGLSARLRQDLGVDGDDVDDLFLALRDEFGTDFSGLDFPRHFREELHMLSPLFFLYRGLAHGRWGNGTITVKHLVRVVQAGRWVDPDRSIE
ncbi:MAG: DUF1493 family protein [Phycisphaerae bacterium]|nr:DUF1493 family protein [Phycisphaerae bacterium]